MAARFASTQTVRRYATPTIENRVKCPVVAPAGVRTARSLRSLAYVRELGDEDAHHLHDDADVDGVREDGCPRPGEHERLLLRSDDRQGIRLVSLRQLLAERHSQLSDELVQETDRPVAHNDRPAGDDEQTLEEVSVGAVPDVDGDEG